MDHIAGDVSLVQILLVIKVEKLLVAALYLA